MKIRFYYIFFLSFFFVQQADASDELENHWYNNMYLFGYGCISTNFVKAWEYPIGTQYEYDYGGMLLYKFNYFSPFVQMAYHDAFISIPNGYVLYRKFSGFDASVGSRIPFQKRKSISSEHEFGTGLLVSGRFDKYEDLEQYMVYPEGGIEFYTNWVKLRKLQFINIGVSIPVKYAFRSSGNYLSIGLSTEISLRIPPEHE